MTGVVDDSGRAMMRVRARAAESASPTEMDVWIDTGLTGDLVLSRSMIAAMGLQVGPAVSAILADGSKIRVDTYTCIVDWFGETKQVEVVVNLGQYPLLGVGLLRGRTLHIDYAAKTVSVD